MCDSAFDCGRRHPRELQTDHLPDSFLGLPQTDVSQVVHSKSLRSRSRCPPIHVLANAVECPNVQRHTRLFENLKDSPHLLDLWCGIQLEGLDDLLHFRSGSIR